METHVLEHLNAAGRKSVQLACVIAGEAFEDSAAFAGDAEDCAALVFEIDGAGEQAFGLGAVYEFDDAVVFEAEARGGVGDADGRRFRCSGDLEKKLMLLRLESGGEGGALRGEKEPAGLEGQSTHG